LPTDPMFGPSTVNIGTIQGGRAPNVIPDHAQAEIFFRLVDEGGPVRAAMDKVADGVEFNEVLCIPAMRFGTIKNIETTVVSYATDIPAFGGTWGTPFLLGPGTIHVAHTTEERVPKKELTEAIQMYQTIARELLKR
jgi:acetylornithine deacetylase